jgi:hypothetical protein
MKYIHSFNENLGYGEFIRKKLLEEFSLDWNEFIWFLEDNKFNLNNISDLKDSQNISFLNKGKFGSVYSYGDDKIIKVTFNKLDYFSARKLIGKRNKHLVNVFDLRSVNNRAITLFVIIMEKCDILPRIIKNYIDSNSQDIEYFFQTEDESYLVSSYEEDKVAFSKYDLEEQFIELLDEMKQTFGDNIFKNKLLDIHSGNFMMKENNLCFIDIFSPEYKSEK